MCSKAASFVAFVAAMLVVTLLWAQARVPAKPAASAPSAPAGTASSASAPAGQVASRPAHKIPTSGPYGKPLTPAERQAYEDAYAWLDQLTADYMAAKPDAFKADLQNNTKHTGRLTQAERSDVEYMKVNITQFRPQWWKSCRSSENTSFKATIWAHDFTANYMPSDMLGAQMPVDIVDGKVVVIVSWRPNYVDSRKPLDGTLAKAWGITEGDLAEVIVWHELGHNFITNQLPTQAIIELYRKYEMLFGHLQEFYADMTALYHCTPKGRVATLALRTDSIEEAVDREEHFRASYAIGSLLLANFLAEPDKWPSVHFPPQAPKEDIERNTIVYVYDHLDRNWTFAEDRQLRELVGKFIKSYGDTVFRSKGKVPLPNKLTFQLLQNDDRSGDADKRNEWVKQKLEKLIKDGRADKPVASRPATRPEDFFHSYGRILIPWR